MDLFIQLSASVFGISAALLLIGGWQLHRWQRNQHRFLLLQAAIERGATAIPLGPPSWLAAMRRGLTILALGVGLMLLGGGTCLWTANVPNPADSKSTALRVETNASGGMRADSPSGSDQPSPQPEPIDSRDWERARLLGALGLMSAGVGFVLSLLGMTSAVFAARVEKRAAVYADQGEWFGKPVPDDLAPEPKDHSIV